jgi:hypothetical protein
MSILMILGSLLFVVGWIWLIVIAFKTQGVLWGILNIFLQPLMGLIFCILKKVGWMQLGLMILGMVLVMLSGGMTTISSFGR